MKKVDISNMTIATGPTHKLFSLRANGILLQVSCTLRDFHEDFDATMKKVNGNFLNSIRYIKLYGKFPKKTDKKKMDKKMNVWTSTDTGISVRGHKMPVPEFIPFSF